MQATTGRTSRLYWANGALAGVAGALALLVVAGPSYGGLASAFWLPYATIAQTLPFLPPPTPDVAFVADLVGTVAHLVLGAVWGLIYAAILRALDRRKPYRVSRSWLEASMLGLAYGLAVYLVTLVLVGPAQLPSLRTLFPTAYLVAHLAFGVVTGLAFTAFMRRRQVAVTFAPEVPAEVEQEVPR
jgi:hypothetical protein